MLYDIFSELLFYIDYNLFYSKRLNYFLLYLLDNV